MLWIFFLFLQQYGIETKQQTVVVETVKAEAEPCAFKLWLFLTSQVNSAKFFNLCFQFPHLKNEDWEYSVYYPRRF